MNSQNTVEALDLDSCNINRDDQDRKGAQQVRQSLPNLPDSSRQKSKTKGEFKKSLMGFKSSMDNSQIQQQQEELQQLQANKDQPFTPTKPVSVTFKMDDRISRQRELNQQRKEKQRIQEEIVLKQQQDLKEREEKEIKEMRKNLIIKANPLPNTSRVDTFKKPQPKPPTKPKEFSFTKSSRRSQEQECLQGYSDQNVKNNKYDGQQNNDYNSSRVPVR